MFQRVFPTAERLLTNALFDRGYRRYKVRVVIEGRSVGAVVWARSADEIQATYSQRGAEMVVVDDYHGGPFKAHLDIYGKLVGDVILLDGGETHNMREGYHGN